MKKILDPILNIFRFHKLKIVAALGFYVFFLYFMFPFNDLGDLVSARISQMTQGEVFVDFDGLNLSLFPQPGLTLSNVSVETAVTPPLTAKSLEVAPSISGLLAFKPGITIRASELLGGDLVVTTRGGDKTPTGKRLQKVAVDFSGINLSTIAKAVDLPLKIDGNISGDVDAVIDTDFNEQPQANLNLRADKVIVPEGTLTTDFGPLPLPRMNVADAAFDARLEKGTLDISKLVVGRPGGDLYASLVGKIDYKVNRTPMGPNFAQGGYDLSVHLTVSDIFKQKFGAMLSFLSAYQSGGNSYAFKAAGAGPNAPPSLTKIQ